jgi:hypothetical protein
MIIHRPLAPQGQVPWGVPVRVSKALLPLLSPLPQRPALALQFACHIFEPQQEDLRSHPTPLGHPSPSSSRC